MSSKLYPLRLPVLATAVASALLLALASSGCGPEGAVDEPPPRTDEREIDGRRSAIINGAACDEQTMPSAVALLVDAEVEISFPGMPNPMSLPIRTVLCTGTLIAPDVVLTAAHCVDPSVLLGGMGTFKKSTYYISFTADLTEMVLAPDPAGGMPPLPELPADAVKVRKILAHEGWDPAKLEDGTFKGGLASFFDIGLAFLDEPVIDVEPAVVITAEEAKQALVKDVEVDIAGWGQQTAAPQNPFQPPPPGTVGKKICARSFINEIGEHEMQIGAGPETQRKCHGDSGGPSYLEVETDHARKIRVVGITSHAYDQTDCAKGGVDTRVDVWLAWLDEQLKQACTDGARSACDGEQGIIPPEAYDPPPPEPDLGVDSGPDGGAGDGSTAGDGGSSSDGGAEDGSSSSGCDCATTGGPGPLAPSLLLLALALLLRLPRRRR